MSALLGVTTDRYPAQVLISLTASSCLQQRTAISSSSTSLDSVNEKAEIVSVSRKGTSKTNTDWQCKEWKIWHWHNFFFKRADRLSRKKNCPEVSPLLYYIQSCSIDTCKQTSLVWANWVKVITFTRAWPRPLSSSVWYIMASLPYTNIGRCLNRGVNHCVCTCMASPYERLEKFKVP